MSKTAQKHRVSIHVWHLEMTEKPDFSARAEVDYELRKVDEPQPELSRYLYATVGAPWLWYQRLEWSWQQWHDFLSRPGVETWVGFRGASPIGYFELEKQPGGGVEIAYFGLLPQYVGRGYGRSMLEDTIEKAWDLADSRIWLHTCSLDHDNALPNYLGRGFRVFREEDFEDDIPVGPLQPWPGANQY